MQVGVVLHQPRFAWLECPVAPVWSSAKFDQVEVIFGRCGHRFAGWFLKFRGQPPSDNQLCRMIPFYDSFRCIISKYLDDSNDVSPTGLGRGRPRRW